MHGSQAGLELVKLEGCGNSFLICRKSEFAGCADLPQAARWLCDADFGIGADGLILVERAGRSFKLEMFNPDGSSMRMCGNGSRCVCRYLIIEQMLEPDAETVKLDVAGREIGCRIFDHGRRVEVDMGEPSFAPESIPMRRSVPFVSEKLTLPDGREFLATVVSLGNPHCVIFFDDLKSVACETLGPLLCNHELFCDRANIGFAQVLASDCLELRVWERGAGLTLACGSGACAAVVAGARAGKTSRQVNVDLPGGKLAVFWDEGSNHVFLSGPAREICRVSLPWTDLLMEHLK